MASNQSNRYVRRIVTCLALLAIMAVLCLVPWGTARTQVRTLPDFTDLVDQVGPSVVNIRTLEKFGPEGAEETPTDDEAQEFFRRFGIPMPHAPRQTPRPKRQAPDRGQSKGVGSGFIFSPDGLIMTNAHVVDGADEVLVTLADKREFKAKILGSDKRSDLALVKIEATGLPAIKVGDVGRLRVGEWVMAIGSPFGLENSVTAGIVSAKQRDTGEFLPFIQTDVAINPGNSGGPLINMRGEVVGINSQILSRSGGFMGISFAIPMDEAVRVVEQLRSQGRVSRGRIGVQIGPVTKEIADSMGLMKAQGALVTGVEAGAPADKAGVEPGDIILKLDGKPIDRSSDLPRFVASIRPGTKSTVTVFRRGITKDLAVTVAEIEPDAAPAKVGESPEIKNKGVAGHSFGLLVSDLSEAQKKELKIKSGVLIEAAVEAAASAGLRKGDVILAVGNTAVASARELQAILAKHDKKKPLNVLFRRDGWTQYAVIKALN